MMFGQKLRSHRIIKRLAKALTRLHVCSGCSQPFGRKYHIVGNLITWIITESRIPLKLVLGGVRIVAHSINSHDQTQ